MVCTEAGPAPPLPEAAPSRARRLVPVAWCAWLLVWLVPSMVVAPCVPDPRAWMTTGSALAAVLAAAATFLVGLWPFCPVLVPANPTARRGSPAPSAGVPSAVRLIGVSALEVLVLGALGAPFLVVAWSLGDGGVEVWPASATAGGLVVLAMGLRLAAERASPAAGRWLMTVALLACGGPPAVYYATAETMGPTAAGLPEASPVVALVRAGSAGWPDGLWLQVARLWLWPAVGVGLGVVGLLSPRR